MTIPFSILVKCLIKYPLKGSLFVEWQWIIFVLSRKWALRLILGNLFRILYPHLESIKNDEGNYLIPLQIIFRNKLPQGSSVFRRLERKEISLSQLNLNRYPLPGEKLDSPIIEFTTKLEVIDRFISEEEARSISNDQ